MGETERSGQCMFGVGPPGLSRSDSMGFMEAHQNHINSQQAANEHVSFFVTSQYTRIETPKMKVWKITFLFKEVVLRFHVEVLG